MKEEKSSVTYNGELIYKVENTIDKNNMVSKGQSIIAVSYTHLDVYKRQWLVSK